MILQHLTYSISHYKSTYGRFFVNLLCGESESSDIALHFNPRFDGRDKVVFNTCQNGSWESEEKIHSMPFCKGQAFEMVILVTSHGYKVRCKLSFICNTITCKFSSLFKIEMINYNNIM